MKKKLLTIVLCLLSVTSTFASLIDFTVDGFSYDRIGTSDSAVIIMASNVTGVLNIPETVTYNGKTYTVSEIYSVAGCTGATSINIPKTITSIVSGAFGGCTKLESINVDADNSNYTVENGALYDKNKKTLVCRPPVSSSEYDFSIPSTVVKIEDKAFHYCWQMTSVIIPNSVTSIGINAFEGCSGLLTVVIPNSVKSIGTFAFAGCKGLISATLPDSIKTLENGIFQSCPVLTSVTIPKSVTSIGYYAFQTSGIKSIVIPDNVTSVGVSAFDFCMELEELTIPASLTSVGKSAFYNYGSLKNIYCKAKTPIVLTVNPFNAVDATLHVPYGSKTLYQAADYWKDFTNIVEDLPGSFTGVVITPTQNTAQIRWDRVTNTSYYTLNVYTDSARTQLKVNAKLQSNYLGTNLTTLAAATTYYVTLTAFDASNNALAQYMGNFSTLGAGFTSGQINGIYYRRLGTTRNVEVIQGSTLYTGAISIPSTISYESTEYAVAAIGDNAFFGCTGLTSVAYTTSVTKIGANAFSGCTALTVFPVGSTVTEIDSCAFRGCTALTAIGVDAANTVYSSVDGVLYNHAKTRLIAMPGAAKGDYIMPATVSNVDGHACCGCTELTSVAFRAALKGIGSCALEGCIGLTDLYAYGLMPAAVGESAFNGIPATCILHVPEGTKDAYAKANGWKQFLHIYDDLTGDGNVFSVMTTATESDVTVKWNRLADAVSYKFTLYLDAARTQTKVSSTLLANVTGCRFEGLTAGTTYYYTLNAYDASGNVLSTTSDNFTTLGRRAWLVNGVYYQPGKSTGTAEVTYGPTVCTGTVAILPAFSYDGAYYKVIAIGDSAFLNNTALTAVHIPSSVGTINAEAFYGCTGMTDVYCYAIVPPALTGTFKGFGSSTCTLHVPMGYKDTYLTTMGQTFASYIKEDLFGKPTTIVADHEATVAWGVAQYAGSYKLNVYLDEARTQPQMTSTLGADVRNCHISGLQAGYQYFYTLTALDAANGLIEEVKGDFITTGFEIMDISVDDMNYHSNGDGTAVFITGNYSGSVVIPSTVVYKGVTYTVTSIDPEAFKGGKVTYIYIPSSVVNIPVEVFYHNPYMQVEIDPANTHYRVINNIVYDYSVNKIVWVYRGVTGDITLPSSVTYIGTRAFWGCTGLKTIYVPASVSYISPDAFIGCSALVNIVIDKNNPYYMVKDGVIYTKDGATVVYVFRSAGTEYSVSADVHNIGQGAFWGNTSVQTIRMPQSVTTIGGWAFRGCSSLVYLYMPNVTEIADSAFRYCNRLSYIILPDGVTKIGTHAFDGCTSLTDIYVYNGKPTAVDANAFAGLPSGCTLHVPAGTRTLYMELTGWSTFVNIVEDLFPQATYVTNSNTTVLRWTQPAGAVRYTVYVYDDAARTHVARTFTFDDAQQAAEFRITGLAQLTRYYYTLVAYDAQGTVAGRTLDEFITGPESTFSEGEIAGVYYRRLAGTTEVEVYPGSTHYTGTLTLPADFTYDGTTFTLTHIADGAFAGNMGLTEIYVPATVTTVDYGAFRGCTSLADIKVDDANITYTSVNGLLCNKSVTEVIAAPCALKMPLILPATINAIGNYAFTGCMLDTLRLPASVRTVGQEAYSGCTHLVFVVVPEELTSLGDRAFAGCTALKHFYSLIKVPGNTALGTTFAGADVQVCILHVPSGTRGLYAAATGWSDFTHIEDCATAISDITTGGTNVTGILFFTPSGAPLARPVKGVNIRRTTYSDGTVKVEKIVVR